MLCTSSHKAYNSNIYKTVAISGNRGKDENYEGLFYPKLAPKLSFWKIWHENIGKISEEENNRYYIEQYYKQVLSLLEPQEVYNELDDTILLCYEENSLFCHRHIVAAWIEIMLEIKVPEVKVNEFDIIEVDKPEYIKIILEDIIKKDNIKRKKLV